MKVHGAILSPYVRKVLVALKLKGLDYEQEAVMPGAQTPEFLAISPLGKIPAFTDGDFSISDSSVICEYLEEKYPATSLLPTSAEDRARARWLEEYADSALAGAVAIFFFQRVLRGIIRGEEPDEAALEKIAANEHPKIFSYLESQIPMAGFLFGDELKLADVSLFSPFVNGAYAGFELDAASYPRLADFLGRVRAHSVVREVLVPEEQFVARMKN